MGAAPGAKAKYVGLVGLGKGSALASSADWGQSPFQSLGGAAAALTKANKSKSVGVAFVTPPSADAASIAQQIFTGERQYNMRAVASLLTWPQ